MKKTNVPFERVPSCAHDPGTVDWIYTQGDCPECKSNVTSIQQQPQTFEPGKWYPFSTIPAIYQDPAPLYGKPFRARQGEWAPFDAWYRNGRFEPIGSGSFHPTHWSPMEPAKPWPPKASRR